MNFSKSLLDDDVPVILVNQCPTRDTVKVLFANPDMNETHNVAAINSINWARILAQIIYYFHSYFSLIRSQGFFKGSKIGFVVPSGKFGDVL